VAVVPPYGAAEVALRGEGGATGAAPPGALETILPKPGGRVAVLAGEGAGERGVVTAIHVERFVVDVALDGGRCLPGKAYSEVTKVAAPS
jgi:hypothetical protein